LSVFCQFVFSSSPRFIDSIGATSILTRGEGEEHRNVFDLRYTGKVSVTDWDVESMYQTGYVGDKTFAAWAVGSLFGYAGFSLDTPVRLAG
jgi:Alginate export